MKSSQNFLNNYYGEQFIRSQKFSKKLVFHCNNLKSLLHLIGTSRLLEDLGIFLDNLLIQYLMLGAGLQLFTDIGACAGIFTCGTWSESHELLGVVDDTGTIYIVKPNGEEMTRITKRHLNLSSPIAGLIVQDDTSEKKSYL